MVMLKKIMSLLVLSTALFVLFLTNPARADYIQVFEKNVSLVPTNGRRDVTFWTYDTLADLVTGWTAPTANFSNSWNLWSNQWGMSGLTYDGSKYIQAFDHKTDARLSIFTYDTYANMLLGWDQPATNWDNFQVPASTWDPGGTHRWTMTGLAYDGNKYIQVFDNNTTAALSIWTFDTLADLVLGPTALSATNYGVNQSVWDPSGSHQWTMAGLTYDGTQYIIGFDNNTTAALSILTFDTFAGLVSGPSAQTGYFSVDASVWQPNTGPQWSMVGLAYVEPIPEPATMLLLGTGLVGVAGAARRKKKNQT